MKRVFVGDFHLGKDEKDAIMQVLDSGRVSEGKTVLEFEKRWSEYIGTRYAVATSSGTGALIVGWQALQQYRHSAKTKKKKVITSPLTYIATSNALVLSGLEPVYVDIDPKTFVITPESIRRHFEGGADPEEYLALNPVHLMGYMSDMEAINAIAKGYGLDVVEDSAQAHGSTLNGRMAGSFSRFSIYSFYIAHNIQAGEMGALNTDDVALYRLVKSFKANGRMCDCLVCRRFEGKCPHLQASAREDRDPRFTHSFIAGNFKSMEFQAALALTQVRKAQEILKKRQANVKYLNDKLQKYAEILQLPVFSECVSYLAYPIVIKDPRVISRKILRQRLEEKGVENRPLFGCIPTQQPAYAAYKDAYRDRLPHADYVGDNGFYIGCHQYMGAKDVDYVADVFDAIFRTI